MSDACAKDSSRARTLWRWAAGLLCLLLLSGCAAVGERRALPGISHGAPEGRLPPSPRYELLWLRTSDGTRIAAELCSAEDSNGKALADPDQGPTLLFFYARPMCLAQQSTQQFHRRRPQYIRRTKAVTYHFNTSPGEGCVGRAWANGRARPALS